MADSTTGSMLRISAAQLKRMQEITRERERTRIAEEIAGRAVVERSLNDDPGPYIADVLDEIAASLRAVPGVPAVVTIAPAEPAKPDMSKLLIRGMEDLPFPGYDTVDDPSLPAAREHTDDEDMMAIARRML